MNAGKINLPLAGPVEKDGEKNVLQVTVAYDLGGYNSFTGGKRPRGIKLGITPLVIGISGSGGFIFERFAMFSGQSHLLLEQKMLNRKKLAAAWADVKAQVEAREGQVWDLVAAFAAEKGLEIIPAEGKSFGDLFRANTVPTKAMTE